MRPPAKACASVRSAASCPMRSRVSRGCGKSPRRSASGSASIASDGRRARHHVFPGGISRRSTCAHTSAATASWRGGAVDHLAAARLGLGDGEKALAQALVVVRVALLEGIGLLAGDGARQPARGGAREPDLGRHVEDEGQVRIARA